MFPLFKGENMLEVLWWGGYPCTRRLVVVVKLNPVLVRKSRGAMEWQWWLDDWVSCCAGREWDGIKIKHNLQLMLKMSLTIPWHFSSPHRIVNTCVLAIRYTFRMFIENCNKNICDIVRTNIYSMSLLLALSIYIYSLISHKTLLICMIFFLVVRMVHNWHNWNPKSKQCRDDNKQRASAKLSVSSS